MLSFSHIVYGRVCPDSGHVSQNALNKTFNVSSKKKIFGPQSEQSHSQKHVCLTRVRHNKMDKNDPEFDTNCDIQLQKQIAQRSLR
jgi:hypothetical protein